LSIEADAVASSLAGTVRAATANQALLTRKLKVLAAAWKDQAAQVAKLKVISSKSCLSSHLNHSSLQATVDASKAETAAVIASRRDLEARLHQLGGMGVAG
jgi:uncharacterized protein (DUF2267 family)